MLEIVLFTCKNYGRSNQSIKMNTRMAFFPKFLTVFALNFWFPPRFHIRKPHFYLNDHSQKNKRQRREFRKSMGNLFDVKIFFRRKLYMSLHGLELTFSHVKSCNRTIDRLCFSAIPTMHLKVGVYSMKIYYTPALCALTMSKCCMD